MNFSDVLGEALRREIEARKVFERLHLLMLAGYKIDLSEDFVDSFLLRHPSKFELNRLIKGASGHIVALGGKFQIALDDNDQFRAFILRQVPRPTWWHRLRDRFGR
jgi:hypothetical protein